MSGASMPTLALLVVLPSACGDDPDPASEGTGETTEVGTAATTNVDVTGTPTTAVDVTGTADDTTDMTDTTDASTGSSGDDYGGYFRLQSTGFQISVLGNYLGMLTLGGKTSAGPCTRQDGADTGFVTPGGSLTVLRGEEILLVSEPLPSPAAAAVTLAVGDMLSFEGVAPEASLPDFMLGPLVVPSTPTDAIAPAMLALGDALTITWTPPLDPSGDVIVEIGQSQTGAQRIQCVVAVADGTVTIEAGLLDHLLPTDEETPMVFGAVSPFDELITDVEGKTIELEFFGTPLPFAITVVAG